MNHSSLTCSLKCVQLLSNPDTYLFPFMKSTILFWLTSSSMRALVKWSTSSSSPSAAALSRDSDDREDGASGFSPWQVSSVTSVVMRYQKDQDEYIIIYGSMFGLCETSVLRARTWCRLNKAPCPDTDLAGRIGKKKAAPPRKDEARRRESRVIDRPSAVSILRTITERVISLVSMLSRPV